MESSQLTPTGCMKYCTLPFSLTPGQTYYTTLWVSLRVSRGTKTQGTLVSSFHSPRVVHSSPHFLDRQGSDHVDVEAEQSRD